jgi:predicted AlkP superfamily pyrophosphatase or phosphodiesterase
MKFTHCPPLRRRFFLALLALETLALCVPVPGRASAYDGHPRLIVVVVIDQFRGDYLDRYRDQFGDSGFRLLLDHGAYFPNCNYDYANTRTAPGHSTLFTGAYTNGHGILANEWWDEKKKRMVTSVEDDSTKIVGENPTTGASPHNLLADTLGDELKLATGGKARVFGISMKDRSAVLPAGFAGDGAYWIDAKTGAWVTSTYYRDTLPTWVKEFNSSRPGKYWDREWKDFQGLLLDSTAHRKNQDGSDAGFYEVVGSTTFGNEYEFEFARELIVHENVGRGPATDLIALSLSSNDILGHQVGPDSPRMHQMALDLDRELADFFRFLGQQVGLADIWIALSADHGVSSLPDMVRNLRIPAGNLQATILEGEINQSLNAKFSPARSIAYVKLDYPLAWLDSEAFTAVHAKERDAEIEVGEALKHVGLLGYYTKSQLAAGEVADTPMGRKYLNSYSPQGSWYVMGVPQMFTVGSAKGTDHASPYTYDTHVPLAFYGLPFRPGIYRSSVEPVDLVPTLASLLGINAPTQSVGRVLTDAIAPPHRPSGSGEGQ